MAARGLKGKAAAQEHGGLKIMLVSSDKQRFCLPEPAARVSKVISKSICGYLTDADITLEFPAEAVNMVVEYCKRKAADGVEMTHGWEREYLRDLGQAQLYEVLHAAGNPEIEELVDLACKRVANMISGKAPAEIRRIFGIDNDEFTSEQREEIRRDNSWIDMTAEEQAELELVFFFAVITSF
ncbi:hypothetical protein CFC21_077204 [Triticum aestivum]|nr:SKP1-like protein 13 [Aegilops tauschii subsp. strangulata]KAF7072006.1 hypothetical protein CFC21_077204 [Triticum aestivum]